MSASFCDCGPDLRDVRANIDPMEPRDESVSGVRVMRLGGWLLGLTGAAALGGVLYLPSPPERAANLAEVTRITIVPARHGSDGAHGTRTFSPASPLFRQVATLGEAATSAPQPRAASTTWSTVVTPARERPAVMRGAKVNDPATRYELARDLQRELRRVGCYGGEITGTWNGSTRRAMSAFMDRANATLPIDTPDYVLLSLVQSHDDIQCGADCPRGEVSDAGGRCVPRAVVAQASKSTKRADIRRTVEARPSRDNQRRFAAVEREQLPWLEADGRTATARAESVPRPDPLPGRMSIGGPDAGRLASIDKAPAAAAEAPRQVALAAETIPPGDAELEADANVEGLSPPDVVPDRPRRAKRAARHDREYRPKHYAAAGKTRRGQPRPGTMRFNLMQSLGGIY